MSGWIKLAIALGALLLLAVVVCAPRLAARVNSGAAGAQDQAAPSDPCAALTPYQKSLLDRTLYDWAFLAKYKSANAALSAPPTNENRVVFMGDSITEGWGQKNPDRGDFFPGKPYVNRGISGQTTPQMLVRFREDVLALKPKVVLILAGVNDIAGNTGPATHEEITGNIESMAELAHADGIRVVLCSVLPASDFPWHHGLEPAPKIRALNAWLKDYAAKNNLVYVNYYDSMVDAEGGMRAGLASDGVHPNKAGYEIMSPIAEKGIAQALAK
jgi:lysophospholipase L1-like esterase